MTIRSLDFILFGIFSSKASLLFPFVYSVTPMLARSHVHGAFKILYISVKTLS